MKRQLIYVILALMSILVLMGCDNGTRYEAGEDLVIVKIEREIDASQNISFNEILHIATIHPVSPEKDIDFEERQITIKGPMYISADNPMNSVAVEIEAPEIKIKFLPDAVYHLTITTPDNETYTRTFPREK